jgi:hypothetical protein
MKNGFGMLTFAGFIVGILLFGLGASQYFGYDSMMTAMPTLPGGMSAMMFIGPEAASAIVMILGLSMMVCSFIVYYIMRQRNKRSGSE